MQHFEPREEFVAECQDDILKWDDAQSILLRQNNEAVEILGHLHDGDRAFFFKPERHMDLETTRRWEMIGF